MGRIRYAVLALALSTQTAATQEQMMELDPEWEFVADTVMGGVSEGEIEQVTLDGRAAMRLHGAVSLENNGGFIQMAFDMPQGGEWAGIEIDLRGNGAQYEVRLRTDELSRPWHSYRAVFDTSGEWQTLRLPWAAFERNKTDVPFDPARLRRMGVLAYGAEMQADIAVASVRYFK
ncbi:CIA30 family protein [Sulfitobacter sp. HNIBRBA2951]|uniref:CIA30 family protein n=1 Tax=Sulfitobacter aquimarinus TaxID=3158557 RepID=UPI0032DEF10D